MESDIEEIRRIQHLALNVYKEFVKACDSLGLRYYSSGGTTVGAILYQGFIPWDDDLDINMPRPDYERFKREAPAIMPSWLGIMDGLESDHADYHFIKLHDKRTTYVSNILLRFPECYTGVFIDIEPIDGAPDAPEQRQSWYKTVEKLYCYDLVRKFGKTYLYPDTMAWLYPNRIRRALAYAWIQMHPLKYYAERYTAELATMRQSHDFDDSTYVTFPRYGMYRSRNFWKTLKSSWDSYTTAPFEDTTIRLPIGYENILTSQYGFVPNAQTQVRYEAEADSHHIANALVDLDKPYSYYQQHP